MGVLEAGAEAVAREPALELAEGHGPARGHPDALQVLLERQEIEVLVVVLVVEGVVEVARVLNQEGGAGDIEDVTGQLFQLLEAEHRLPAAGGADQDEGRAESEELGLRLVEGEDLVEDVEFPAARVDVTERQGVLIWDSGRVGQGDQLVLLHRGSIEEPGFVVGMVPDDLEEQDVFPALVGGQPEEEPVGVVELGAVIRGRGEFPHVRRTEIAGPQPLDDSFELGRDRPGVKFVELQDVHRTGAERSGLEVRERILSPQNYDPLSLCGSGTPRWFPLPASTWSGHPERGQG